MEKSSIKKLIIKAWYKKSNAEVQLNAYQGVIQKELSLKNCDAAFYIKKYTV